MAKLAVTLALILVVASIQCITLCAAPSNPPCPHHQKTVDSCSHELVYVQTAAVGPEPRIEMALELTPFECEPIAVSMVRGAVSNSPPLRL